MDKTVGLGPCLQVKCGSKSAEFFPLKCKKLGNCIGKCVKHNGRWMSPSEFECLAGMKGKKWRVNIKFEGKPLGQWLEEHDSDPSSQKPQDNEPTQELQVANEAHCISDNSTCSEGSVDTTMSLSAEPEHVSGNAQEEDPSTQILPLKISRLFSTLEEQLSHSLKVLVKETIESLKKQFECEFEALNKKLERLNERMSKLESVCYPSTTAHNTSASNMSSHTEMVSDSNRLENQVAELTAAVSHQQKQLDMNERQKREKNMIVMGVSENENGENLEGQIRTIFENQLEMKDVGVLRCRRLGKKFNGRTNPRPILVSFETVEKKMSVMKRRTKLAGTKIYLNHDLPREQMVKEKELRKKKRYLLNHQQFKEKRVTIYKGHICIDGQPITDSDMERAGLSQ